MRGRRRGRDGLRLEELLFASIAHVAVQSMDVNDEAIRIEVRPAARKTCQASAPLPPASSATAAPSSEV
ncbi:hypothetical protein ACWGJW_41120 [Streptomyces nigrescens]